MAQHMKKGEQVQMVTANRLGDGVAVYLTKNNTWTENMAEAEVAQGEDAIKNLLERASPFVERCSVIDPYAFPVKQEATANLKVTPLSVREIIRMQGPTVRTDLGKQSLR